MNRILEYINCSLLHQLCVKCVCLQCCCNILMSQPFYNRFWIHTGLSQKGVMRMPQAVGMKQHIAKFVMNNPGTILERFRCE